MRRLAPLTLGTLLLCLGAAATVPATASPSAVHTAAAPLSFPLLPASPAMAACLAGARAQVSIVPGSQNDTLSLYASGLPAFAGFTLYVTAHAHPPYGIDWPLTAAQADANGMVHAQVRSLLLGAAAAASHLVLFFAGSPETGQCAGAAVNAGTLGPAALASTGFADAEGPLARSPFAPPRIGISSPGGGHGLTGQAITFISHCADPAGWTTVRFVDFRLTAQGAPVFWARLDRPAKKMYLYDPAGRRWLGPGTPGAAMTLRTGAGTLSLAGSAVLGTNGTTGRVVWAMRFAAPAAGHTFAQSVRVTDVRYQTRGWNPSGTYSVD